MKTKNFFYIAIGFILLACCISVYLAHSVKAQVSYILPLSESEAAQQTTLIESQLSYALSDGECFEIVVETWREGVLVDTVLLRTLDGSESTICISANDVATKNSWVWSSGEQHVEIGYTDDTLDAFVWDALTLSSFENTYDKNTFDYTNNIVLICVGFSENTAGIQAIDCLSVMEDSLFLSRYEYAQVVCAKLIHG